MTDCPEKDLATATVGLGTTGVTRTEVRPRRHADPITVVRRGCYGHGRLPGSVRVGVYCPRLPESIGSSGSEVSLARPRLSHPARPRSFWTRTHAPHKTPRGRAGTPLPALARLGGAVQGRLVWDPLGA